MTDPASALIESLKSHDLLPPETVSIDGQLHRFDTDAKRGKTGWYVVFPDNFAGAFGDWRTGLSETLKPALAPMTPMQQQSLRHQIEAAQAARRKEIAAAQEQAKTDAGVLFERLNFATDDNPYLSRKHVKSYGVKADGDTLVVPVCDVDNELWSVQFIEPDGSKKFYPSGKVGGNMFIFGREKINTGMTVYVCEGYATGASIFEAIKMPVVCAFNAGNLPAVCKNFRKRFGNPLILVADNDQNKVGETMAIEAAELVDDANVIVTPLIGDLTAADANDYANHGGDLRALLCEPELPASEPVASEPEPEEEQEPSVKLGERDRKGNLILSPVITLPTAQAFVAEHYWHEEVGSLIKEHKGELLVWNGSCYTEILDAKLRSQLQPWLDAAKMKDGEKLRKFPANNASITNALQAIKDMSHADVEDVPSWLSDVDGDPQAKNVLAYPDGLLDVTSGLTYPPTPRLFNTAAIDFNYDANANDLTHWQNFLASIWEDDEDAKTLLQEWFGYCLSGQTHQQKMMMLVGPKRCGKGTIGRTLTALMGRANVAGPTVQSLATSFGLAPLVRKNLAIIPDAKFEGQGISAVIENLLCISGEDTLTVDRKWRDAVTVKLPTRFMFLTNDLPRVKDTAGAFAGRLLILRMGNSFYGHEDLDLPEKINSELPAILNWALEGLARLNRNRRFTVPASANSARELMEDLGSPMAAFLREMCVIEAGAQTPSHELYQVYCWHLEDDGVLKLPTRRTFGRDLAGAEPRIQRVRATTGDGDRPWAYKNVRLQREFWAIEAERTAKKLQSYRE